MIGVKIFLLFLDLVITYSGDDNVSGVSYTTCLSYRSYGMDLFLCFFRVWSEKVIDNSGTTSMWLTIGIRVWSPNPKINNIFLQRSIMDSKLGVT